MTRIVLNPTQLSQTASELDSAAGEYQAIGAQVLGCDCGCMPADVAAVVDNVTADVRGSLQGISSELGLQASDLSQRAGVSQDGGFTAVDAAYGSASSASGQEFIVGGNFDIPLGGTAGGGQDFIVGGNFDIPLSPNNVTDGYLALAAFVGDRYQQISNQLAAMGPVYSNDANPFLTSSLIRGAWDAQRRLDVVMSPTYHDSSYFENRSDYLDQFPVDIRPY